ncbi:MAG: DNA polymerase ligase N-terminal domain-containing protein [Pirellulales bacterium]
MPRFALLEHTAAPDDPAGLHYDLLLEQGERCRTWRLATIPEPDGPEVVASELPPHRLAWLDHEAGDVSGGRGFARRIDAGTYEPAIRAVPDTNPRAAVTVTLHGQRLAGQLSIVSDAERSGRAWLEN